MFSSIVRRKLEQSPSDFEDLVFGLYRQVKKSKKSCTAWFLKINLLFLQSFAGNNKPAELQHIVCDLWTYLDKAILLGTHRWLCCN